MASRFVSRRSPFHARVRSRCPFIALALRPSFILFSAATAHTKASSTLLILCSFFFSLFLSFFFLVVYRGNSSDKYFASRLFNNDGCATIRTRWTGEAASSHVITVKFRWKKVYIYSDKKYRIRNSFSSVNSDRCSRKTNGWWYDEKVSWRDVPLRSFRQSIQKFVRNFNNKRAKLFQRFSLCFYARRSKMYSPPLSLRRVFLSKWN